MFILVVIVYSQVFILNLCLLKPKYKKTQNIGIKQNNKCLICETDLNNVRKCVDHCHKTNKVRGVLCNSCNAVLGFARDDINILNNAINYLKNN